MSRQVATIDLFGGGLKEWRFGPDAGFGELPLTKSGHGRIRVFDGKHNAFDAGCNQRAGARSGSPGVSTRLEADVNRCAGRLRARRVQRFDFGVMTAGAPGESLADDSSFIDDDATDGRIRLGACDRLSSQRDSTRHQCLIAIGRHASSSGKSDICVRRARLFGLVFRRSISS